MFHKDGGSNFNERTYDKRQVLVGEKKFYLKDGKYAELSEQKRDSLESDKINFNLLKEYKRIRSFTVELDPLSSEDTCGQSMPDVAPAKWHAAHTAWFCISYIV